jgi:pyruvate dehydrogenase E1 component beta subunit
MMIPGLKVVAPSTPADVVGLLAAAIRDPDPVMFFEHKGLFASSGMVPTGIHIDTLGTARILRAGSDCTIIALAAMVPVALLAAEQLANAGIEAEVIDLRSLVPLDTKTIFESVAKTARVFTVEENPRLCGWGAEIVSQIVENQFFSLDAPPMRITTPHIPLSASKTLEGAQIPTPERVFAAISQALSA